MACDKDCECGGRPKPERKFQSAHAFETCIGFILVRGHDEVREGHALRTQELEALARDDAFWMRLWRAGINDVQLRI